MTLSTDDKHKAFMGYRKGLRSAAYFVGLRRIELTDEGDIEFESYHRFNHVNHFVKIGRVFSGHEWQDATDNPYQAGVDAGENAHQYFKDHASPVVLSSEKEQNVDSDISRWMQDLMR